MPPNGFIYSKNSIPPNTRDTLIVAATVLPSGNTTNICWLDGFNVARLSDTLSEPIINDDAPPVITCPTNITVQCADGTLPAITGTATATDNTPFVPILEYDDITLAGSCPNEYTITRTWTATDNCNNTDVCVQTIEVIDTEPPILTCPVDTALGCTAESILPEFTGTPLAEDGCGSVIAPIYSDITIAGMCAGSYTIVRTWTAEDACDNISTCEQEIIVGDIDAPDMTCPANLTIQCSESSLPANTGFATATDVCSVIGTVDYTDMITNGACPDAYLITRTWTAADDCGNEATCVQMITIIDTDAPSLTCPASVTIECTASTLPANTGQGTSSDNCDGTPTVSYLDATAASPDCGQEYIITRTWTTSDNCGNSTSCAQVITIVDTTPPVLNCPANVTIGCTANTLPVSTGNATATDACQVPAGISFTDNIVPGPGCTQEYSIQRTWMASDACGNSTTCVQTITIDDNAPPVLNCPPNVTIACTASTLPANTGASTASDICDPGPVVNYTDDIVPSPSCPQEYVIQRTWSATDACGNASTCLQLITIDDNIAPSPICPANVTIECSDSSLPANTGFATASDNCDPTPASNYTDLIVPGSCAASYTIQRTWTSTDECGNTATCLQSIFVEDTTVPLMSCPANVTIDCGDSTAPAQTGSATGSDACDPGVTISHTDVIVNGPCPEEYTILRTWVVTDDCSNSTSCVQTILIRDTTAPVMTCPAPITIECTASTLPGTQKQRRQQMIAAPLLPWFIQMSPWQIPHVRNNTLSAGPGRRRMLAEMLNHVPS